MSITLIGTGASALQTSTPVDLFSNQANASVSFLIRYTGTPASIGTPTVFGFRFSGKLFAQVTGSSSTAVTLGLSMIGASGTAQGTFTLLPDITYHIVGTWTAGDQRFYSSGVQSATRTVAGNTSTNTSVALVLNSAPAACPWTLSDLVIWNGYTLSQADVVAIRDGTDAATIGTGATRGRYSLAGTSGATPAVGDAGIKDAFGTAAYDFSVNSGGWTGSYSAPLVFVPAAQCNPVVLTSGTQMRLGFSVVGSGAFTAVSSVATIPTVAVNGTDRGALVPVLVDSTLNTCAYYRIPGAAVVASDVVTLTAPRGFATTAAGLAEAMVARVAENCVGRSAHGADAATKTLRPGMNMNWGADYYLPYDMFANAKFRVSGLGAGNSITTDGVLALASTSLDTLAFENTTSAGYGANTTTANSAYPDGYYAVAWDDIGTGGNTTTLSLKSASGNTTVAEVTSSRNFGTGGAGQVRVFLVSTVAKTAGPRVYLSIACPTKAGKVANLWISTPWNFSFTAGTPATIDRSDPYRLDAKLLARFPGGIGCVRPQEAIFGAAGLGLGEYEPEDISSIDDAMPGIGLEISSPGLAQIRPWDSATAPYIYTALWGSTFQATLGASITGTGTPDAQGRLVSTITISDAATAPVLVGLNIRIGSEDMGVLAVSGTSVTVRRGSRSSTPATHTTGVGTLGSVTVSGRIAIDLTKLGNNNWIAECVAESPHGLATGPLYKTTNAWPTGATLAADGRAADLNLYGYLVPIYVTGASTFLIQRGAGGASFPPTTLTAAVTCDPVTLQLKRTVAEGSHYPLESAPILAKGLGSDLHMTVPCGASDDFVDSMARKCRDILPAGRTVWVEYVNEPWNFNAPYGFGGGLHAVLSRFKYAGAQIDNATQMDRGDAIRQRWINRFDEGGRNRGGEIRLVQNQFSGGSASYMTYAGSKGYDIGAMAIAPYLDTFGGTAIIDAFRGATTAEKVDLAIADVWYGAHGSNTIMRGAAATLASYNATYGKSAVLYGYEGGDEFVCPVPFGVGATRSYTLASSALAGDSTVTLGVNQGQYVRALDYLLLSTKSDGTPNAADEWVRVSGVAGDVLTVTRGLFGTTAVDHSTAGGTVYARMAWIEHQRDMVNHPNWAVFTADFHMLCQSFGMVILNHYAWTIQWSGQFAWGVYHNAYQLPGKGDGTDGLANNLLYPVTPGATTAIPAGSTQDMMAVNPRGYAINQWMAAATTPTPPATAKRILFRKA